MTVKPTGGEDTPSKIPAAVSKKPKQDSREEEIIRYCDAESEKAHAFLEGRNLVPQRSITPAEYDAAQDLCTGVSGAKKISLNGAPHVLKMPFFTKIFLSNYLAILDKGLPVRHRDVSGSDDSFADFPRKEVLGFRLAKAFGIEVPHTELVRVGGKTVGSLQRFVTGSRSMAEVSGSIKAADIDFESMLKILFFQFATENSDGHEGNVLLLDMPPSADEDEYVPPYKAVPIDYSLIFPRHQTLYPNELSLIKRGIFKLIENRNIKVTQLLSRLNLTPEIADRPDIRPLLTDAEHALLVKNLTALQMAAKQVQEPVTTSEFYDLFLQCRQKLEKK